MMRRVVAGVILAGLAAGFNAWVTPPARAGETKFAGFVDASYGYDVNARAGGFGLDQAELDIVHQGGGDTRVRADFEWVKDGGAFAARVEQGFMEYSGAGEATFTLGQFNAPIGFELPDPHEMYQFSHSLVFTYGLPVNITGAMIAHPLGAGAEIRVYAVNGWDQNAESNRQPTWGGRAGFTRGVSGAGLAVISGRESDASGAGFRRTVFDIDLSSRPKGWILGGELNAGQVDAHGDRSRWLAVLAMAHREFNQRAGLTVRYDRFHDRDGFVFGGSGAAAQIRQAFTLAPTVALDEGFGAVIELRIDHSDRDVFLDRDGSAAATATTMAFGMTYAW